MDRSTVIGLVAGFGLIFLAIVTQGNFIAFVSIASLIIVLGGVVCATIIQYSINDLSATIKSVYATLRQAPKDPAAIIEMMVMFARRARRNGLLVLDDDVMYVEDNYLRNGLELAIDGISEENLVQILDDEIKALERRQDTSIKLLESMAGYAPAFGMIGTIIGLVMMLQNLTDPESLGVGLSIALITTFYGTMFANLIFAPLAGKMLNLADQELANKEMLRSGVISLANGENPRIMEKKMLSYVSPDQRAEYIRINGDKSFNQKQEEKLYNHWINQQKDKWENVLSNL